MAHTSTSGFVTQIGEHVVRWGTGLENETYGYVTSISQTVAANTQEYKDHEGIVKTVVAYDPHDEYSVTVTLWADKDLPKIMDKVEWTPVGGGDKVVTYVTSASVNWQNEGAASLNLGVRTYNFTDSLT